MYLEKAGSVSAPSASRAEAAVCLPAISTAAVPNRPGTLSPSARTTGSSQSRVQLRAEATAFQQGPGDVVGEVPEAERGAAEAFEPAVDGFGGAVGGAGPVEVGEHVGSDDAILTAIRQRQQRWGINRLIREDAIDKLAPLLPRLHETTE
jgi:hypothetical protein